MYFEINNWLEQPVISGSASSDIQPIKVAERNSIHSFQPKTRIYALSDIHGHPAVLARALQMIDRHLQENPLKSKQAVALLTLGDMIDKGPDSRGVIDALEESRFNRLSLLGNHEYGLIRFMNGPQHYNNGDIDGWRDETHQWVGYGSGYATLQSYGVKNAELEAMLQMTKKEICVPRQEELLEELRHETRAKIEAAGHLSYYDNMRLMAQWRHFVFCHAQLLPDKRITDHMREDVTTGRTIIDYQGAYDKGSVVVHGHTHRQERRPIVNPYSLGIDPGVMRTQSPIVAVFDEGARVTVLEENKTHHFDLPRGPTQRIPPQPLPINGFSAVRVSIDKRKKEPDVPPLVMPESAVKLGGRQRRHIRRQHQKQVEEAQRAEQARHTLYRHLSRAYEGQAVPG